MMLTQAEIDALLSGTLEIEQKEDEKGINLVDIMGKGVPKVQPTLATQIPDDKQVRPYNFWSPDRFSKDQMRAVELVHEELAERLTSSLPSFLRTNLRPKVVHTEQGRFPDFLADLPPNSLLHLITLAPLPSQFVLTISPDISFLILEQRLGGASEKYNRSHSLTDIDQSLIQDLVENMLNDIKAAWGKVVNIEPKMIDSTVNHNWVQMMMGNERVMMITFELVMKKATGTMSLYISFSMLKPIGNDLNPRVIISGRKEQKLDPNARQLNMETLAKTEMPMRVMLGSTRITVKSLLDLELGDVMVLDSVINQDVEIKVGDKSRFMGRIGKQGKHLAIQITKVINPFA